MEKLKPYQGHTGMTGDELDEMDADFSEGNLKRLDDTWPVDASGAKLSLGHSPLHEQTEMGEGTINMETGVNDPAQDPVVSQAQRRAMYAAKEGKSKLGIPKSVGAEMIEKSHGITGLPERSHKKGE